MSYRGPKIKKSRRLGIAITPKSQKYLETRPTPPGMHGRGRRMNKQSDYGRQLMEKQRLRFQYNLTEHQLRKTYKEANRIDGSTPDNFIVLLETRLDAVVLRAGFARSIFAARQYVKHGHFLVNGKPVDIPSYQLKVGAEIRVRDKSKGCEMFAYALSIGERQDYITTNDKDLTAILTYEPTREEIPITCDVPVVVEYYSR